MHFNSIRAYWEEIANLSGRRADVYHVIKKMGEVTDRQVKDALGFSDMNAVRPRITELVEKGLVEECGDVICPVTGKTVRKIRIYKLSKTQQIDLFTESA